MTSLHIEKNWKRESYNSIFVIVNPLIKIVYYKPVKISIDALALAEIIIDRVLWYQGLLDTIVTDKRSLFPLKLRLLLRYFVRILRELFTALYPKTDDQTEQENSTMKVYLRVFVNFKQNNWAKLLLMAKYAYNNIENTSSSRIAGDLNHIYFCHVSFKEEIDTCCKWKSGYKLVAEL